MAAVLLVSLAGAAASAPTESSRRCLPGKIAIATTENALIDEVCAGARSAVRALEACGVGVKKPLLIEIVDRLRTPHVGGELGFYHRKDERVVVLSYQSCRHILGAGGRFGVPMTTALYRSLVGHEVAHAVIGQQGARPRLNRIGHEYAAYAIQFLTMEQKQRQRILDRYPHAAPITTEELNELYLDLSPPDFAVKAFVHFRTDGNGCIFLKQLLDGSRKLPTSPW